jgi:hypothetical protein
LKTGRRGEYLCLRGRKWKKVGENCILKCFIILVLGQLKEDEMVSTCSTYTRDENAYRIFIGKPEGKRPLGRSMRRWYDNNGTYLREIGLKTLDWILLV